MLSYRKIIICGARDAKDEEIIRDFIYQLNSDCIIIHGGCVGVDTIAGKYAKERGMSIVVFPAKWKKYGRAAGPIRNKQMLSDQPDLVVAFHYNLTTSKGTKRMVDIAIKAGIQVQCFQIPF